MNNKKKEWERPTWDEIFMLQAILCATRHSCLKRGVGAVVEQNKKTKGTGYNGAASGIKTCLEYGYCYYEKLAEEETTRNKGDFKRIREEFKIYCQAVHAEANAINQCLRECLKGATLYVTNYPCPNCAQSFIIGSGIKKVKIWKEYLGDPSLTMDEQRASERKFLEAGISVSWIDLTLERMKEVTAYMAKKIGERTSYRYKSRKGVKK